MVLLTQGENIGSDEGWVPLKMHARTSIQDVNVYWILALERHRHLLGLGS